MIYRATCGNTKCRYEWNSRLGVPPKECPKCKSRLVSSKPLSPR